MPRSLKKGPFIDHHLVKKVEAAEEATIGVQLRHGRVVRWFARDGGFDYRRA